MTTKTEQKPLPYYKEIHRYFLSLTEFLDITTIENNNSNNENNNNDGSNSLRSQKARAKLLKLSPLQFYELCTDVTDELNRRIRETGDKNRNSSTTAISNNNQDDKSKSYLLPEPNYHLKRNQARQKLSHLSQLRFNDLIGDILFELRRRGYHIVEFDNESILDSKMSSPEVIDSNDIDISKIETHDITENTVIYDTENTSDLNVGVPLPSMIQSSLVIPQKASIDWSEEDEETGEDEEEEEEENKKDETNTYNYKSQTVNQTKDEITQDEMELGPGYFSERGSHLADDNKIEYVDITEDFIQHDLINNPFNTSGKDLNNAILEDTVIKIPSSKSHDGNTNDSNAKLSVSASSEFEPKDETSINFKEQRQRHNNDITSNQLSTDVTENNSESNNDDKLLNRNYEDVTITEPQLKRDKNGVSSEELSKQSSDIFSSSREQSTVPTLLQSPGSASHLQNELVSLNKQFTALSIENERLKTKILELEVINSGHYNMKNNNNNKVNSSKSQEQGNIINDNNTLHSLKHENIAQFIKEYGVIPETLITQLYNVVNDMYSHINNARRSDMNLTNSSSNINFGKTLFQLVDQLYEIILKIIDLLSQSEEKDKIVLLKSTFSNLITTSKYFALYHHILPDIVIISSINECIFIIMDIVNILKVKEDTSTVEKNSFRKVDIPIFKPNVGSTGIPLTPPPNVISSNNSSEVSSLDGSPVKPLKIIEKVASSPLVNGNNGEDFRRASGALRKPSNNALISLTSLVKKHSNEKLITNKDSKDAKSNESISNISSNTFYKRSTSSLIKRMSFTSYSMSSSSESENNDDTDDTEGVLQNLRKQKKEVDPQFQGASSLDKKTSINLLPSSNNTLKLNTSDSTPVVKSVDKNVLKKELPGEGPIERGELMKSLKGQGIIHKPKSSKEFSEQEVVERREFQKNLSEQELAHKLELRRNVSEKESLEGKEFQEEIANQRLTEINNLGVVSMEQESVERHDLIDDLTGQGLLNNQSASKKLCLQESFERCNLDENLLKDDSSHINKPNTEVSEEELVEREKFRQDLTRHGFLHEPQSKDELSQKKLHIPSIAVSSETNTISGISLNGKIDKQFSQPNIKTKYQFNPMSSHDNDSTSDAISYSTKSNKVLSDTDKHPPKCKSNEEVISSPFLHNDSVESTDINGTPGNVIQNNNFGKLNIKVVNEESSTKNVLSSPQVTNIKPNNDAKISHIKERSDRIDKHIIPEKKVSASSKVENTISSPNLNTSSLMKSIDSPIVKPFKIMKFESRSLKKINLLSKDTKNENMPGLGIIIGENDSSSTKLSEINNVDAVSLELPDDKEMGPINKSEQCGPNGNTSDRLSSSSFLLDQEEKEIVADKTLRRKEADDFDMLDDKNPNMRPQKGGNLKIVTSSTISQEYADETHSDESSETIHPLELVNQKSLKEKSVMEADETQCNGDNSNVNSYISHDSLDLNQTKYERGLSNLKETNVIPGFKRNNDIFENINEHTTVDTEENPGHISDRSIRDEGDVNNGITMDDDSFQFIPLQSKNINDVSKNSYIKHNFDDGKGEQLLINKPIETNMVNMTPEAIGGDSEIDSEVENSTEGSESETGTETSSAMSSDSGSEYESDSNASEEPDNGEEEEEDFDVEAFDIENPDNTLSELLLYLEHQTVQVITTIQSLLASIKEPKSTKGDLRNESNAINQVIKQMVGATSISMNQSRNANLKEHGSWVVQSLKDCSHRMITLCQLSPDDQFKVMDNDTDYADKNFKQRLAGISFDIAKCTKELVKSVEEASLKEEIEYLNSKIHKK